MLADPTLNPDTIPLEFGLVIGGLLAIIYVVVGLSDR